MDDIPQEILDILDSLCGVVKEPLIFSPEWWNGGYGEAFLAHRMERTRREYIWSRHNGWPNPLVRETRRPPDEEPEP